MGLSAMKHKHMMALIKPIAMSIGLFGISAAALSADIKSDKDKDGIVDVLDNCVHIANPNQIDFDADGFGNQCDGDFNNDKKITREDFSNFKRRFETGHPSADINENGKLDEADHSEMKRLMEQGESGPSSIVAQKSFLGAPPPASSAQLYRVEGQKSQRRQQQNAALLVDFGQVKGLKKVIAMNFSGKSIALNDLGIPPDIEPEDGRFAAFLDFDFKQQEVAGELFRKRNGDKPVREVAQFAGRSPKSKGEFSTDQLDKVKVPQPIELRDGTRLTPFAPIADHIKILPVTHDPMRSLMVNEPAVVSDPARTFDPCDVDGDGSLGNVNGAWSFKTLMANMANTTLTGLSTQDFINEWLIQWMTDQTVNSFTILARQQIQDFFPGWDGVNASTLDIDNLPFRLLAIVNRIDLAQTSAYGVSGKPGEIRLVFGLVDPLSSACVSGDTGSTRSMTVIFEYGDTASLCRSVKSRAQQWVDLSTMVVGSPAYNAALQDITDDVTLADAVPGKPNGSALNQLRTNEIALAFPWQLREFVLPAAGGLLESATIKQTPDPDLFRLNSPVTAQFMADNADAISCETHLVPELYQGNPFLGSFTDYGFGTIWNAPDLVVAGPNFCTETTVSGIPTQFGTVRHKLSLNTCDDCHSGETSTVFTHIDPRTFPSDLSGFLTGITVPDPVGEPVTREFNDLARRGNYP